MTLVQTIARRRVPLGFLSAAVAMALATPTSTSLWVGGGIAALGEWLRIWAAGHIEKGREVTQSGPYRVLPHPLYAGSAVIGVGFAYAAANVVVALLVAAYLSVTIGAAMHTEEAALEARFPGEYARYRDGRSDGSERRFSLARVMTNHEYRAVIGLLVGFGMLYVKSRI